MRPEKLLIFVKNALFGEVGTVRRQQLDRALLLPALRT